MSDRIGYAGDWHGNTAVAVDALFSLNLRGVKKIIQVGDFGFWPGGKRYLDAVQAELDRNDQELWWIDGNHEDHATLLKLPVEADGTRRIRSRIHHLPRGHRWTWDGTTYLAVGGAVSIDRGYRVPGREWWPEEVITDENVADAVAGGPVDVLVCHDAPTEVPKLDEFLATNGFRLSPSVEADAYRSRVQIRRIVSAVKPQMVVHGHYHFRYDDVAHGARIVGLDCDGSGFERNVMMVGR